MALNCQNRHDLTIPEHARCLFPQAEDQGGIRIVAQNTSHASSQCLNFLSVDLTSGRVNIILEAILKKFFHALARIYPKYPSSDIPVLN